MSEPDSALEQQNRRLAAKGRKGILSPSEMSRYLTEYYEGEVTADCIDHLARLGIVRDGARVLDVGCGFGAAAIAARKRGAEVTAIDVDADSVAVAHARRLPGMHVLRADATSLPFVDGGFDLVVMLHVLEHVRHFARAMDEAVRVLRPGGHLYIVAPNYLATLQEPHYHVPWIPLLPRGIASRYLRMLGKDERFFERSVFYTTWPSILSVVRRHGLTTTYPRVRKLDHPQTIRRPVVALLVNIVRALGLVPLLRRLAAWPLQSTVEILARVPLRG